MSVQSCLNRLDDIDRVVYDSYKCVLNESYKFDTKVDVMCKYEHDLDIVYELCGIHESYEYDYVSEYNDLMHEFNTFENEYIQEGVIDKVKGVIRKIIDLIKRFLSFIGRMLKSLFEKLFKKKLKKTATQVAEEYISVSQVKEYMESGDDNNDNSVKVFFPASKDSKVASCYVDFIVNNLRLKIENGKSLSVSLKVLNYMETTMTANLST